MGFEPTISTLTGWRALRAALRGRIGLLLMAQAGFEPAASFVLSEGGLPVAYRAVSRDFRLCPEQESNLHTLGFKPSRSAVGVPGPGC